MGGIEFTLEGNLIIERIMCKIYVLHGHNWDSALRQKQ